MKIVGRTIVRVILVSVLFGGFNAIAQEKKIKRSEVPAAVIAAFTKAYPDAKMKGFATEREKGIVYYEIESVRGRLSVDALLLPDGTFYEIEEQMAAKDLPAAVSGAVNGKYPKTKIQTVEKVTKGNEVSYVLGASDGKSSLSLTVDQSGKFLMESERRP